MFAKWCSMILYNNYFKIRNLHQKNREIRVYTAQISYVDANLGANYDTKFYDINGRNIE